MHYTVLLSNKERKENSKTPRPFPEKVFLSFLTRETPHYMEVGENIGGRTYDRGFSSDSSRPLGQRGKCVTYFERYQSLKSVLNDR